MHIYLYLTLLLFVFNSSLSASYAQSHDGNEMQRAQKLVYEGYQFLQQKKYRRALKKLKQSYQIVNDIKVLAMISSIYNKQGFCENSYDMWWQAYMKCAPCDGIPLFKKKWVKSTKKCTQVVHIEATPYAQVFKNGEFIGKTPLKLPLLYGSHRLTLRSNNFWDKQEDLDITEGQGVVMRDYLLTPITQANPNLASAHQNHSSSGFPHAQHDPTFSAMQPPHITSTHHSLTWWEGMKIKGSATRQTTRNWLWASSIVSLISTAIFTKLTIDETDAIMQDVNNYKIRSYQEANGGNRLVYHSFSVAFATVGILSLTGATTLFILDH